MKTFEVTLSVTVTVEAESESAVSQLFIDEGLEGLLGEDAEPYVWVQSIDEVDGD